MNERAHIQARHSLYEDLARSIQNVRVLDAMMRVPRHAFVSSAWAAHAYKNVALPIGRGQTISQPQVVARVTELVVDYLSVSPRRARKVLEIGAGCGYQAMVLGHFFFQGLRH